MFDAFGSFEFGMAFLLGDNRLGLDVDEARVRFEDLFYVDPGDWRRPR